MSVRQGPMLMRNSPLDQNNCIANIPNHKSIEICHYSNGKNIEIDPYYFKNLYKGKFLHNIVSVKKLTSSSVSKLLLFRDEIVKQNSRFRHESIILLMAFNIHKNSLSLVYEFFDAVNLHILYLDKKDFPEINFNLEFKNKIATQLLRAIIYLHGLEPPIYHQAIRPNNVLVNRFSLAVKLSQFDIDIDLAASDKLFYLRRILQYESPDIANSLLKTTTKTTTTTTPQQQQPTLPGLYDNIWSLGCTLFYLGTEMEAWQTNFLSAEEENIKEIKKKMSDKKLPENLHECEDEYLSHCITYDKESQYTAEKIYSFLC